MSSIQFRPDWDLAALPAPTQFPRVEDGLIPVVVGEDDAVTRALLSAVVTRGGFRVILAKDGHETMVALRKESGACVVIVDWTMPGMDGAEVCRRIRSGGKSVYVIMLTARYQKEDAVKGLESGADDYLTKPFDQDELLARIRVGMRILKTESKLLERLDELQRSAPTHTLLPLAIPL